MRTAPQYLRLVILMLAIAASVPAQERMPSSQPQQPAPTQSVSSASPVAPAPEIASAKAIQVLTSFRDSDVKFDLRDLMEVLRDRKHEGWVLAAYPDPKTGRPLIGAGFSLDLAEREHPQLDQSNPHPFLEPSSAELWQAAGLDSQRLNTILDEYNGRLEMWGKSGYRSRIRALPLQITDEDATLLLRISAIQAIYNARAYCRNFDRLQASQQMALSQLVYQMGVNLAEFSQFLKLVNADPSTIDAALPLHRSSATETEYWRAVQQSLIQSQWAQLYRTRAASVIAMLDPEYVQSPVTAERRVGATLRPAVVHRRRSRPRALREFASTSRNRASGSQPKGRSRTKHRV